MRHKTWKCPPGRVGMRKTDRWKTETIWRCKNGRAEQRSSGCRRAHVHNERVGDRRTCSTLKTCARSKKKKKGSTFHITGRLYGGERGSCWPRHMRAGWVGGGGVKKRVLQDPNHKALCSAVHVCITSCHRELWTATVTFLNRTVHVRELF